MTVRAKIQFVDSPFLSRLSEEERRGVVAIARRRRFKRREVVFHDGDPGDSLHLVSRGHVAIRITTPLGDVATLRVLAPGEFFGELALIADAPRRGSAVAIDDVETLSVHRDQLDALRATHPWVDRVLVEALATEVRRLASRLVEALYAPVEQRVWRRLAELTAMFGSPDASSVRIPLTQDEFAQIVGTTRPTVNRLLRAAEADGVVQLSRGRLEVLQPAEVAKQAR
jgi:CRP/FNR family cyclic AMP-dependent transcriptional regulator